MKKDYKILTVIIGSVLLFAFPLFCNAQEENAREVESTAIFSDVDLGNTNYVGIKHLSEKGIIDGYSDGTFKPWQEINRIEALKIILNANNLIDDQYIQENSLGGMDFASTDIEIDFNDIYKSQWYFPYLKKGVTEGIVTGYPDKTFRPTNTVNRVESYKIAMESDKIVLPEVLEAPFADVPIYEWFSPYIQEGKNREIVYFTMENQIYPGMNMTRGKFAELVYRYMMSKSGSKFGKASYYSDYLEGHSTSSGEPYLAAELTAANRTLPFNTIVRVTNMANNKSVIVRINDRGPYITGRSLDLSKAAFESIASVGSGVICVQYEIVE
ncbi:septal ring lytic transglycosylase RlpA family protein [Patescibacteria group bacterium]|nr:septal ring lytic transglycosylase RlpA family protein [Patescibacteria group bacterium]